jgi:DNA polymerase zeta
VFYAHHVSGTDIVQSGTVVRQTPTLDSNRLRYLHLDVVSTELELLNRVVDIVVDIDPDILVGWEVQRSSWGYAEARAKQYGFSFPIVNKKTADFSMQGFEIADLISRAATKPSSGGADRWISRTASTFKVTGRHVLNLWRVMRSEQTLNIYSFENVAFHLLRRRWVSFFVSLIDNNHYIQSPKVQF